MIDAANTVPPDRRASPEALSELLARLGAMLLEYGCATNRLEECLQVTAACHGHTAQVFATPTGLWLSVGDVVRLVRVQRWTVDLDRLAALDRVFNQLSDGELDVAETTAALDAIASAPRRYPAWTAVVAGGLASGSAALFFGGGVVEASVGFGLGLVFVVLSQAMAVRQRLRLLTDFSMGLLVGFATWAALAWNPGLDRRAMVLAAIIVAVPGMTLTAGLTELAEKNLVSGTARLMDAVMVMVSLVFGVAAAAIAEKWVAASVLVADVAQKAPPSLAVLSVATVVAGAAFVVLFVVPPRDAPWAIASGVVAWGTAVAGERLAVPAVSAAFVGALATGVYANVAARITDRPAQIYLLPGIVLLVPGAFGYVSFELLLWGDVTEGTARAFTTLLIAGALALGLLIANAAVPARKVL